MSIFEAITPFPPDPIFGLGARFKKDPREEKVDLTVGIFHTEELKAVTLESVKEAERRLIEQEKNKVYLPIGGKEEFIQASKELVFGKLLSDRLGSCLFGAQTIGGTGALRLGGEFLAQQISKSISLSSPTWPNHEGIFAAAGMQIKYYPYYNDEAHLLDLANMLNFLSALPPNSIVLFHAGCHNPTGCDPNEEEWKEISILCLKRKLIPFFDFPYLGFGKGIEEDCWPIRYFAEMGHEMLIALSFSKSFSLYGERVGALIVLSKNEVVSHNLSTVIKRLIRVNYSNPPLHGASLVSIILHDKELKLTWEKELDGMRKRVEEVKISFYEKLVSMSGSHTWNFLKNRYGMFSLLGLQPNEAEQLITEHAVYLTSNGRVNLTGINDRNLSYVVESILKVRS